MHKPHRAPAIRRQDLKAWLNDRSGTTTFYDRHTDRFLIGKCKASMLRDGLRVFEAAIRNVQRSKTAVVIVLNCEMRSGRKILNSPPQSIEVAEANAMTPPLIYRFPPEQEARFWNLRFRPVAMVSLTPSSFELDEPRLTSWFAEARFVDEFDAGLPIRRNLYFRFQNQPSGL